MTSTQEQPALAALAATNFCEAFALTVKGSEEEPALRSSDGEVSLTWAEYDSLMKDRRRARPARRRQGRHRRDAAHEPLRGRRHRHGDAPPGAVPLSLYNSSAPAQLAYLFDDAGVDVVIVTEAALAPKVKEGLEAAKGSPRLVVVDGDDDADVGSFEALAELGTPLEPGYRPDLGPDDLITVVYTSGTTGAPKGAELTHSTSSSRSVACTRSAACPREGGLSPISRSRIWATASAPTTCRS